MMAIESGLIAARPADSSATYVGRMAALSLQK
jgi:hypothetical protein